MKRIELVSAYLQAKAEWENLLTELDETEIAQVPVNGGWTVKDMIAHLTWHEREMIQVAEKRALVGSPWWALPLEQRNAAIYELYKDRPLDGIVTGAQLAHQELLQAINTLNDEDMLDPSHFSEMPSTWQPWQVFASNLHEHYQEHTNYLRNWLVDSGKLV